MRRLFLMPWLVAALVATGASPALAQIRTIDPNAPIDSDLHSPPPQSQQTLTPSDQDAAPAYNDPDAPAAQDDPNAPPARYDPDAEAARRSTQRYDAPQTTPQGQLPSPGTATETADTYDRDDLIGAAEGVFGKGAQGLAGIIESILKDQGRPNAYIAGREASGAFVVGLRYGSGTLFHKIEGQRPVYWTGPSVGFDVGGDANKVFVLVYNLYDSEELYKRFPAGEGHLYFVGGFSASYLRSGNTVLIPVRLGVGVRAGVNIGYMKFTKNSKWLPF